MRNNKFYKDGRNFTAKTDDGDYCPGTLGHKKTLHSKSSKFLLKILNCDWSGQFHGSLKDKELSYCHKQKFVCGKPSSSRISKNTDCFFFRLHTYSCF